MKDNFTATAVPTVEQVKAVWLAMEQSHENGEGQKPSTHLVSAEMKKRGWKVSASTVSRYKRRDWTPCRVSGPKTKAEKAQVRDVKSAFKGVAKQLPPEEKEALESTVEKIMAAPKTPDEAEKEEAEIKELHALNKGELGALSAKENVILNVLLARRAQRRVNLLALIPKDTSSLVSALHETQDATAAPAEPAPAPQFDPAANPVANAIAQFRRKQQGAA